MGHVALDLGPENRPKVQSERGRIKKIPQKVFHAVIYLKIPFYPHRSIFGCDEDFFFFFQNIARSSPKRQINKKQKQNCIICAIATYKQCKQNLRCTNNAKKFARFRQKSYGY